MTANTIEPNRVGLSSTFNAPPQVRDTTHTPENAANETMITTSEAISSTSISALSYTVRERRVLAGPANTCSLKPTYTCLYERIGRRGVTCIALWRPQFLSPTWLNNFPFPSSAPLTLLSSLSGWPEQAGPDFLILGLSFLSACQQLASSFVKRT